MDNLQTYMIDTESTTLHEDLQQFIREHNVIAFSIGPISLQYFDKEVGVNGETL